MPDYGYGHNVSPFILKVPGTTTRVNVRNVTTIDTKKTSDDTFYFVITLSNKRVVETTVSRSDANEFLSAVSRGSNVYQK